jgi:NitT/TauT family transport system substrate-binding protein
VLCTLRASSYRTARDLEGQAVGVATLVSLSSIAVKAWLIQNGADLAKIRLVEMPSPQIPAALERGTIAAGLVAEPILCQIPGDVRIFASPFDAVSKRLALNNWFTTKDWIAGNRDTAKRLLAAIYDTARWANSHHDESIVIIAKHAKLDIDRVRTMRRATYATSLEARVTQPVLDSGYKYKAIDRQANAADLFAKI